ncbi:hypothetical protein ADK76_35595 [Streptomyces griseoflavus]|nr:hypothetical protein ADK76_35595 [Streptomyces griseoflavus]
MAGFLGADWHGGQPAGRPPPGFMAACFFGRGLRATCFLGRGFLGACFLAAGFFAAGFFAAGLPADGVGQLSADFCLLLDWGQGRSVACTGPRLRAEARAVAVTDQVTARKV